MMSIQTYRRTTRTLEANIGNELVTLDAESGDCFGFNEVAATVWRHLATPKRFDQLRDALLHEYDVDAEQCATELQQLLDDFVGKGLLTVESD